ncbi:hypothetical protein [Bradyrhizobium zhanjiangense]|uniref:Uncharacterized protein n=1 Tax=Bradyrhizobium zhanjiangense TaxID=1325107 RepID=A0A4Q0RVQ8_9BRAD|nr:hypothetical protein [Bradyrhizobium zhanjiangense]RXH23179.1 hypothetical protein XH94_36965 [Bradyrhizobium zhanjiangense]
MARPQVPRTKIQIWPSIADALEDIGEIDAAQAMRRCGCYVIVDRYERGTVFRAMKECNHLVCPTAQRRRAAKLVEEKGAAIEGTSARTLAHGP